MVTQLSFTTLKASWSRGNKGVMSLPIIDRFEGDMAVCEQDGKMVHIPRSAILGSAKEGDVLLETPEGYVVGQEATADRRKRIEKLMDDLWK